MSKTTATYWNPLATESNTLWCPVTGLHGIAEEQGRLFDAAFGQWLEQGHYASRPPGELHGPFKTDVGCVVLEISFPNRAQQRG